MKTQNNNKCKFTEDQQKFFRLMRSRSQMSDHKMIMKRVDIVRAHVPFLIGLDFLDKYKFHVNNVKDCHCKIKLNLKSSPTRRNGHCYLEWSKRGTVRIATVNY